MRARGGWGLLLLVTIATLASPAHAATKAEGSFTAQDVITVQGDLAATFQPLALLANDTAQASGFLTTAPRADVCIYEQTIQDVTIAGQSVQAPERREPPACSAHTTLRLEPAEGNAEGWLGIDPDEGSRLSFTASRLSVESRASAALKSEREVSSEHDATPFFVKRAVGPLLYAEEPGAFTFTGGGSLKVKGLDFWLVSDGNRSKVETGEWVSQTGTLRERFARWAVVHFTTATVTLSSPAPLQVAARDATATFTGDLHMRPTTGALQAGGEEYRSTGKPETFSGTFTAALEPRSAGAVDVTLNGELRSASIAPAPAPFVERPAAAWGLAVVVGAVVVAGGTAAVLYKRRHPRPRSGKPHVPEPATAREEVPARVLVVDVDPDLPAPRPETPEEAIREEVIQEQARTLVERGRLALGASNDPIFGKARLEDAAYFFQRAWQLYPCLGEAAWGLGLVRFKEGNWRPAITQFLRASCYIDTGEPEVMCARGALRLGEEKAAGDFLHAALHRAGLTPSVFEDVHQDAALRAIIDTRPDMAQVWQEAMDHFYPENPLPEDGQGPRA